MLTIARIAFGLGLVRAVSSSMSELVACSTLDPRAIGRSVLAGAAFLAARDLMCKVLVETAATTSLITKILTVGALRMEYSEKFGIWTVLGDMTVLVTVEALWNNFCLSGAVVLAMSDLVVVVFATDIQTRCLHLIDGILGLSHLDVSVKPTHDLVAKE